MSSYDLSPLDGPDGARIVFGGAPIAELDPNWWKVVPRGWRETALGRWGKLDPDCVTPQILIKMVPA